jgi:hypothetical protein
MMRQGNAGLGGSLTIPGTAGFPVPGKRFDIPGRELNVRFHIICPILVCG